MRAPLSRHPEPKAQSSHNNKGTLKEEYSDRMANHHRNCRNTGPLRLPGSVRRFPGKKREDAEVEQREICQHLQTNQPHSVIMLAKSMEEKRRQPESDNHGQRHVGVAKEYAAEKLGATRHLEPGLSCIHELRRACESV